MSTPISLSFDYKPSITGVSTTTYTVPSGKFAYVVINVTSGSTVVINGVSVALKKSAELWLTSQNTVNINNIVGSISFAEYFSVY